MTPDQFAAWLVSRGIRETSDKYYPPPTPDGPNFNRQAYSSDCSDVLFYVYCTRFAAGMLTVRPIMWICATQKWRWYDGTGPFSTDRCSTDPVDLLRQELARQAARCWQLIGIWTQLHTEVLGLDLLVQSEPSDVTKTEQKDEAAK